MSERTRLNNNPSAYLRRKRGTLGIQSSTRAGGPNPCCGQFDPQGNWVEFDGTEPFSLDVQARPGNAHNERLTTLNLTVTNIGSAFRFLRWQENRCSYMMLDLNAKAVFTAFLSGCNMYVAVANDGVWIFHANANDHPGANNNAIKSQRANAARQNVGAGNFLLSLERGVHDGYRNGASGVFFAQRIVPGCCQRTALDWRFFFRSNADQRLHFLGSA